VPTNAAGLSYRHRFFTAEYGSLAESPCSTYNDFHLALLDSNATGIPSDKNIAFDANGSPVNSSSVEYFSCSNRTCHTCPGGIDALVGTGLDAPSPTGGSIGGATDWLTASGPVVPGETIELQLMVFDVSDNIGDTSVLLDAFEWTLALCGNASLDPGEQCDDGNLLSSDGCSATCTLEP
jgi:cysteine-rich repeat protein